MCSDLFFSYIKTGIACARYKVILWTSSSQGGMELPGTEIISIKMQCQKFSKCKNFGTENFVMD